MRAMVTVVGMLLGGAGCTPMTSPACVGQASEVEVDHDLGGFSAESHAAQRSASFTMVDSDGRVDTLELRTEAIGPVSVVRGADCSDNLGYSTDVEISLKSADGRVDLELDGVLHFDGVFGGGLSLEVDAMALDDLPGRLDLPQRIGATDTVIGVELELSGYDGEAEIEWILPQDRRIGAARLEVPWTAVEAEI